MKLFVSAGLVAVLVMHTSPPAHPCHLSATDRWADSITVEYAQMYIEGATLFVTTADKCLCLVYADRPLLDYQTIILAGRTFNGSGSKRPNGFLVLEKVCDTLKECE